MTQLAAFAAPERCVWCDLAAASTIHLTWPTCAACAADRMTRVRAYQARLERAASRSRHG